MKFLKGCYGLDLLSLTLFTLSLIFNLFKSTFILSLALVLIVIFRFISKNIYARRNESDKFNFYLDKLLKKFGVSLPYYLKEFNLSNLATFIYKFKASTEERKLYKITKCPKCKQKLRLPRGKGKIVVSCKKCNSKFDFKT